MLRSLLFACVLLVGAHHALEEEVGWHEDPANNFLKNVYFTDGLHDWAGTSAQIAVVDGVDRPLMTVKASVAGGTPGIVQSDVAVTPGSRYRLQVRGYSTGPAPFYPWAGNAAGSVNYEWSKSTPLPQLTPATVYVDFTVPEGVSAIKVGALWGGQQKVGEGMVLEFISLMIFSPNWLSNEPATWKPMNGVTPPRALVPPAKGITVSTLRTTVSNGAQQNGVFQEGISVLPSQRYRLTLTGSRSEASAFVVPRILRSTDGSLVAAPVGLAESKATSLTAAAAGGSSVFEFNTPEDLSRVQVAVVFSTEQGTFSVGSSFTLTGWSLVVLPNLLPDGELNQGIGPWKANGDASLKVVVDSGDNAIEGTVTGSQGTPGIRLDNVPVVPGRVYHFAARARLDSVQGNAYPWIQEPDGEDLFWVYKNSFPISGTSAAWRGATFIAPKGVNFVNVGLLFSHLPTPFAAGDKIVMRSAMLTSNGPESFGRPPPDPVRPIPPPPPPPAVIPEPPPAPPVPWADAEKVAVDRDLLLKHVVRASANARKPNPTCDAPLFSFLAEEDWNSFSKCAASCQVKFYNTGEPGDNKGYDNYRVCYDCCSIRSDENDGLTATGSGNKQWVPVTASMILNHRVSNVDATYRADKAGRLFITGKSMTPSCSATTGAGMAVFIKGEWTKITYTETFTGRAACAGVFGGANNFMGPALNAGLLPYSREAGDLIYDRVNMKNYDPNTPGVTSADCSPQQQGWWDQNNTPGGKPMSATAALRRDPNAAFAGLSTGTNCGLSTWTWSDIFVWM
jgi:hypothetical protein